MDNLNDIIGYICPIPLFNNKVPRGSIFKKVNNEMFNFDGYIMPVEIVKRWNPIYKDNLEIDSKSLRKIKGYKTLKDLPECITGTLGKLDLNDNKVYFGIHSYTKDEIIKGIGEWFEFILEPTQEQLITEVIELIKEMDDQPYTKTNDILSVIIKKYKILENE